MVEYNLNIPDGPNNPSADQPKMKVNTNAVDEILSVDHVSFKTANGGTHKKITYIAKHTAAAVNDPSALSYTNDGVANSAHPQLYYKNSQGVFPLSAVRAFGTFLSTKTNALVTASNSFNVDSITGSGFPNTSPKYRVVLTANAVNGENAIVLLIPNSTNGSDSLTYTFTNPNLDIIVGNTTTAGININFLVIQI